MLIRLDRRRGRGGGRKLPPDEERPEGARRRQTQPIVQSQRHKSRPANVWSSSSSPLLEIKDRKSSGSPAASSVNNQQSKSNTIQRMLSVAFVLSCILQASQQFATCSMCQHHQALLLQEAAAALAAKSGVAGGEQNQIYSSNSYRAPAADGQQLTTNNNLIVCPKSSQFNDMPQFPSHHLSPTLERQQRHLMQHLNASFANHLQRRSSSFSSSALLPPASGGEESAAAAAAVESPLIDDELLNEIISPLVVDAAYERAKELIVKRRKLENELVRQGKSSSLRFVIFARSCPSTESNDRQLHSTNRLRDRHEQADGRRAPPAGHDNNFARKRTREVAGNFRRDEQDPIAKVSTPLQPSSIWLPIDRSRPRPPLLLMMMMIASSDGARPSNRMRYISSGRRRRRHCVLL